MIKTSEIVGSVIKLFDAAVFRTFFVVVILGQFSKEGDNSA